MQKSNKCKLCDKIALYKTSKNFYCYDHKKEADEECRKDSRKVSARHDFEAHEMINNRMQERNIRGL